MDGSTLQPGQGDGAIQVKRSGTAEIDDCLPSTLDLLFGSPNEDLDSQSQTSPPEPSHSAQALTANPEPNTPNTKNQPPAPHLEHVNFPEALQVDSLVSEKDFIINCDTKGITPTEILAALERANIIKHRDWEAGGHHWTYGNPYRSYIQVPDHARPPLDQAAREKLEIKGRHTRNRSGETIVFKLPVSTPKDKETVATLTNVPVTMTIQHIKYMFRHLSTTVVRKDHKRKRPQEKGQMVRALQMQ